MSKNNHREPLVSIACITYNHESYIGQAIQSFIEQKRTFPIEIIIGEDKSTDDTLKICKYYQRKYPGIIKILNSSKNLRMMKNFIRTTQACNGKYIALCEGDDYWTNLQKLQSQFDLMERNPEVSMCYHAAEIVSDTISTRKSIAAGYSDAIYEPHEWYKMSHPVPTASLFFRAKYTSELPDWLKKAPVGDVPLRLFLSQQGKVVYLNKIMSARRTLVPGSWNDRNKSNAAKRQHHQGMIEMYRGFNKFTDYKYDSEVAWKLLIHLAHNRSNDEKPNIIIFFLQNIALIKKLPLRKQLMYISWLVFPEIQTKLNNFTSFKVLLRRIS